MTCYSPRPARRIRIALGSALLLSLLSLTGHPAGAAPLSVARVALAARPARAVTMPAGLAPVVARTLPLGAAVTAVTWSQQAEITTTHHSFNDGIGNGVALSGTTALVSAIAKFNGQGAVYVFVRSGNTWIQQALLTAFGTFGAQFGEALALDGDTALVGAPMTLNPPQGAAFVFVRHGTTWSRQAELTSSDGIPNDSFGWSVALRGDTALIGAIDHNSFTGSAYIFARHGTTWTQQAELTASNGTTGSNFGSSVALNGTMALVGAPGWPGPPGFTSNYYIGRAYVFAPSGGTWTQQAILGASDAKPNDRFGISVAMDGNTALIGATGRTNVAGVAYVFVDNGGTWSQQAKLVASDTAADDYFGQTVALSGDTALIGAPQLYPRQGTGIAYIFVRNGGAWSQQAELIARDAVPRGEFGISTALQGGTALIGATGALPFNGGSFGAAYVFVRSGANDLISPAITPSGWRVGTQRSRPVGRLRD